MSTLTVWKFQSADAAEDVETKPKSLRKEGLIKILDAAVVSWPGDRPDQRLGSFVWIRLDQHLDTEHEAKLRDIFGDDTE